MGKQLDKLNWGLYLPTFSRRRPRNEEQSRWSFIIRFLALALPAWFLWMMSGWTFHPSLRSVTVAATAQATEVLGLRPAVGEAGLMSFGGDAFFYRVTVACTALEPAFLFAAAIIAYRSPWPRRWIGLAVGLLLIFFVNIARLASLAWLGLHVPEVFDAVHMLGWQGLFLLVVGLLWWAWVHYIADPGAKPSYPTRQTWVATGRFVLISAAVAIVIWGSPVGSWYMNGLSSVTTSLNPDVGPPDSGSWLEWSLAGATMAVALFLAAGRIRWSRRLSILAIVIPVLFLLQVWTPSAIYSQRAGATSENFAELLILITSIFPLLAWVLTVWGEGVTAKSTPSTSRA